ncbi:MAG: transposase [Oscillochloridaceae bacterium umkhey_bin13]
MAERLRRRAGWSPGSGRLAARLCRAHAARSCRHPLLLGLDTSSILRPEAKTSADRTYVYQANAPTGVTPVAPGWSFSGLVVLAQPISSWSYVLDQQRSASTSDAVTVGATQLRAILPLLSVRAILLLDRYYSRVPWILATAGLPIAQFIRARCDQVLDRAAPPRTGKWGGPRKDGLRFKGSDSTTHGTPDATATVPDAHGRTTQVDVWSGLHLRKAREVAIRVVRITRAAAAGTKRDPRESWFWWLGETLPPLEEVAGLYGHRFGQEHGHRVDKQQLVWDAPHVRTPAQFELWMHVVAMVRNQLVVARTVVTAERRPWETTSRPATPQQVRRALLRSTPQHARNLGPF